MTSKKKSIPNMKNALVENGELRQMYTTLNYTMNNSTYNIFHVNRYNQHQHLEREGMLNYRANSVCETNKSEH